MINSQIHPLRTKRNRLWRKPLRSNVQVTRVWVFPVSLLLLALVIRCRANRLRVTCSSERIFGLSSIRWGSEAATSRFTDSLAAIRLILPFSFITKTRLYNFDPLKPNFYIVKLGFTGVYNNFLISVQKHRLWVLVRTASPRRF